MASVKSNVGHMEAAAFTCALLKVLLMFEHRTYAPVSAHFTAPSPDIDFVRVRRGQRALPADRVPPGPRAGVVAAAGGGRRLPRPAVRPHPGGPRPDRGRAP
jgi:acyl transferase domain-containing protein